MSKVQQLSFHRAKRATSLTTIPEKLELDQLDRLFRLAGKHGFALEEVIYASLRVRLWAETNAARRRDWPLVILNALHEGWGLRGFGKWLERGNANLARGRLGLQGGSGETIPRNQAGYTPLTAEVRQRCIQSIASRRNGAEDRETS